MRFATKKTRENGQNVRKQEKQEDFMKKQEKNRNG